LSLAPPRICRAGIFLRQHHKNNDTNWEKNMKICIKLVPPEVARLVETPAGKAT
jgi:hypothetical protein